MIFHFTNIIRLIISIPKFLKIRKFLAGQEVNNISECLLSLGPTFVKAGQILSTRRDILDEKICQKLEILQDNLPNFSFEQVKKTIEKDFDKPIDQLYRYFDPTPIASASIAQVHRAITNKNQEVIVKVLRPNIKKKFIKDVNFMRWVLKIAIKIKPKLKQIKLENIVNQFAKSLEFETNFSLEAAAITEFKKNFRNSDILYLPKIYWDLTSNNVLTEEFLIGFPIDEIKTIKNNNIDIEIVVNRYVSIFFTMIIEHGFFHADLHPGNVLILRDGRIALIDFGIVGHISSINHRIILAKILKGILDQDYNAVVKMAQKINWISSDHLSIKETALIITSILEPIFDKSIENISLSKIINILLYECNQFNVKIQPELVFLQRASILFEGVNRIIAPNKNIWNLVSPVLNKWLKKQNSLRYQIINQRYQIENITHHLPNLFIKVKDIIDQTYAINLKSINKNKYNNKFFIKLTGILLIATATNYFIYTFYYI